MKRLLILSCALLLLSGFWAAAPAYAGNITIFDNMGYLGSGQGGEDHEVEPGCTNLQIWDLEAFTLTGRNLSMIGGYNFRDGATSGVTTFTGGDIFISTGANALYGASAPTVVAGNQIIANGFNYNYVIRLNITPGGTSGTYSIYSIGADSLLSVYYSQNNGSNPWRLVDGQGTLVGGGTLSYATGLTDLDTGFLGGTHYSVTLADLPNYLLANDSIFHYTYQCGNDNLMGQVPIPPTALLLGSGLLALVGLGWRRRKS